MTNKTKDDEVVFKQELKLFMVKASRSLLEGGEYGEYYRGVTDLLRAFQDYMFVESTKESSKVHEIVGIKRSKELENEQIKIIGNTDPQLLKIVGRHSTLWNYSKLETIEKINSLLSQQRADLIEKMEKLQTYGFAEDSAYLLKREVIKLLKEA